jgi:hypothetical protein
MREVEEGHVVDLETKRGGKKEEVVGRGHPHRHLGKMLLDLVHGHVTGSAVGVEAEAGIEEAVVGVGVEIEEGIEIAVEVEARIETGEEKDEALATTAIKANNMLT